VVHIRKQNASLRKKNYTEIYKVAICSGHNKILAKYKCKLQTFKSCLNKEMDHILGTALVNNGFYLKIKYVSIFKQPTFIKFLEEADYK